MPTNKPAGCGFFPSEYCSRWLAAKGGWTPCEMRLAHSAASFGQGRRHSQAPRACCPTGLWPRYPCWTCRPPPNRPFWTTWTTPGAWRKRSSRLWEVGCTFGFGMIVDLWGCPQALIVCGMRLQMKKYTRGLRIMGCGTLWSFTMGIQLRFGWTRWEHWIDFKRRGGFDRVVNCDYDGLSTRIGSRFNWHYQSLSVGVGILQYNCACSSTWDPRIDWPGRLDG